MESNLAIGILIFVAVWLIFALIVRVSSRFRTKTILPGKTAEAKQSLELEKLHLEVNALRTPVLLRLAVIVPIALTLIGLSFQFDTLVKTAEREKQDSKSKGVEIKAQQRDIKEIEEERNALDENLTTLTDKIEKDPSFLDDNKKIGSKIIEVRFRGDLNRNLINELRSKLKEFGEVPNAKRDAKIKEGNSIVIYATSFAEDAKQVKKIVENFFENAKCPIAFQLQESSSEATATNKSIVVSIFGACHACENAPIPTATTVENLSKDMQNEAKKICANQILPKDPDNIYGSWVNWDTNRYIDGHEVWCKCRKILRKGMD